MHEECVVTGHRHGAKAGHIERTDNDCRRHGDLFALRVRARVQGLAWIVVREVKE
jgi:hypothetical protein